MSTSVSVGAHQSTSQESLRTFQAKGTHHHCVAQSAVIGSTYGSDQVSCVGLSVFRLGWLGFGMGILQVKKGLQPRDAVFGCMQGREQL